MVDLFAFVVAVLAAAIAVLVPLWRRGGLEEIRRRSDFIITTFAALVATLLTAVWAASAGHQDAATVVSAVATVAAALLLLLARDRTVRLPRSFRIIVWLVLVISFAIVLLGLRRTMGFA